MKQLFKFTALLMAVAMMVVACAAPESPANMAEDTVNVSFQFPEPKTTSVSSGSVDSVLISSVFFQYKAENVSGIKIGETLEWTNLTSDEVSGLGHTLKLGRGVWNVSLRGFATAAARTEAGTAETAGTKAIFDGELTSFSVGDGSTVLAVTADVPLEFTNNTGKGSCTVTVTFDEAYAGVANKNATVRLQSGEFDHTITLNFGENGTDASDAAEFTEVDNGIATITVDYLDEDGTPFGDTGSATTLIMTDMHTTTTATISMDVVKFTINGSEPEGSVEDNIIPKVFNSIFDIYPGNIANNAIVIGYAEETKALDQTPITYPYEIYTSAAKDSKGRYTASSLGLIPIVVTNQTDLNESRATAIWLGNAYNSFTETNEYVEEIHYIDNAGIRSGCKNLTNLKKVVLGNNITSIGSGAFKDCKNLTEIVVPDSVRSFGYINTSSSSPSGDGAFQGCISLETINLPEGLITIGDKTFYGCTALHDVSIPSTVTEIGCYAFYKCDSITSLIIPEGVEEISYWTFAYSSNLESVVLPSSLTKIGSAAFQECKKINDVNIPSGVTEIASQAFLGCKNITSITIPGNAVITGHSAFSGCTSLTSLVICDGVTSTGSQTFSGCNSLNTVSIPDSITTIGNNAFSGCSSLTSIVIPENITTLYSSSIPETCNVTYKGTVEQWNSKKIDAGYKQDVRCTDGKPLMRIYYDKSSGETYFRGLTPYGEEYITNTDKTLTIPDGVTIISASYGLKNCAVKTLVIPTSVQRIFSNLFADAKTSLELINYDGTVDEWLSIRAANLPYKINVSCSDGYVPCIIYTPFPEGNDTQSYWSSLTIYGKTFTEVTFSNRSPRIGSYVLAGGYSNSNSVVEKVVVEEGVKQIDSSAFINCRNLTEVVLPSSITTLGNDIFKYSNNMANLYINMPEDSIDLSNIGLPASCTIHWNSTGPESV